MDWLVSSPRAISPSAPGANGAIGSTWSPLYVGSMTLLAGVVVDLTLPKMIEILSAGKGTLEDLTRLGHHSMGDAPRGDVGEALDAGLELLRAEVLESSTEDDAPDPRIRRNWRPDTEAQQGPEAQQDPEEQQDSTEEDPPAAPPTPQQAYIKILRGALTVVYADDSLPDPNAE